MTRVVVADDHRLFRQGLSSLFSAAEGVEVVGEASDGKKALELIVEHLPDIAVLDLSMPEMDGIDVLRELRRKGLPTRVILVTMHTRPELAIQAMEAGVSGYVLKTSAFEDLLQAIETALRGDTFISPQVTVGVFRSQKDEVSKGLSPREKEVLKLIAVGLTNRQIAEKLSISINTVETHRMRIIRKLALHTTAELVRYAIQKGILTSPPDLTDPTSV